MTFCGLTNHVRDNFICELLHVRKGNPNALMMHKPFQPNIFSGTQRMVAFGNVKQQIFKELFLSRVSFLIRDFIVKKTNNGTCSWLLLLFHNLVISRHHGRSRPFSCLI
jgi:hypothetical protein